MTSLEAKQQYEGGGAYAPVRVKHDTKPFRLHLNQLVKDAEKLAVIESEFERVKPKIEKIDKIYSALSTLKWISITIGIGVIINIFRQPIIKHHILVSPYYT